MAEQTYLIRRFHIDDGDPEHRRVIERGLTLSEAQRHCQDPSTQQKDDRGLTIWFDGYEREQPTT